MKRAISTIMICAVTGTASFAQAMLKVQLADRNPINISLDGRYFNTRGQSVTVGDLPPGRHYLRIYESGINRRGQATEDVIYEGSVRTVMGAITTFTFDAETGGTNVQSADMNSYAQGSNGSNNGVGQGNMNNSSYNGGQNNYNGNGYSSTGNTGNSSGYNNGGSGAANTPGNYNTDPNSSNAGTRNNYDNATGSDNKNGSNNVQPSGPVASPVSSSALATLTDAKRDKLKTKVAAKNTDTEKMTVLKDGLKKEKVSTTQVSDMMDWFTFESSKVDFAKWAYDNTVDKESYSSLNDKFSYKSSQEELNKFIQSK